MHVSRLFLLGVCVSLALADGLFAGGTEAKLSVLVRRAAPADMVAESTEPSTEFALRWSYEKGALDRTGTSYVVAAYANGTRGVVRVFRLNTEGKLELASEARVIGMFGDLPFVRLIDVDDDRLPEIIADFEFAGHPSGTWVLKWAGGRLVNVTPTFTDTGVRSVLNSAVFQDLDGDGVLEAINSGSRPETYVDGSENRQIVQEVFRFEDGRWTKVLPVVYYDRVYGGKVAEGSFFINRPNEEYEVVVGLGSADGKHVPTRGTITINGMTVADLSQLGPKTRFVKAPLTARYENAIKIDLSESRLETIFVAVRPVHPLRLDKVVPKAHCVWKEGGGLFTASFGYSNPNKEMVRLPVGAANTFAGDRADRGQPEAFLPGDHDAAFWAQSEGSAPLAWTLDGNQATADGSLVPCDGLPPARRVQ